jgi:proline racemase
VEAHYDWLRKALMREPRGHNDMFGVFLTPPSSDEADAGMIWIDGHTYSHMCGHGTIALSMAMVATGLFPATGAKAKIRFETTAGTVVAEVESDEHRVLSSKFQNVPAFLQEKDIPLDLPGLGHVKADVVFGGNYFGVIDVSHTDLKIYPENGPRLREVGLAAREQIQRKYRVAHPTQSHISGLNFVTLYHAGSRPDICYRNVHVFSNGQLDRSPGGTGTSSMMAMLEARGRLKIGQTIKSEGLLGNGTFEGCLLGETMVDSQRAVIPTVKGTAEIIGSAKWIFNDTDPIGEGFIVL